IRDSPYGERRIPSISKDKGHEAQIESFLKAAAGRAPRLIPPEEILEVSRATLALVESMRKGVRVALPHLVTGAEPTQAQ
ncbi:MAG: hypothetical protein N2515_03245, partial [Deltaproteobacteria bacterium]|nr:hypothetical protein [Deltaproteobacteria bacterium]